MNIPGASSFLLPSCYPMPYPVSALILQSELLRAETLDGGSRKQAQLDKFSKYRLPS